MTKLVLPGGTDVAEMGLFAVASMPETLPENMAEFDALESAHALLRYSTGSDGGYLLHAYVDEPVPEAVLAVCVQEEKKEGALDVADGRIAFGGTESCCQRYAPDKNIRSDAAIAPGRYAVTAWMTEAPPEQYDRELAQARAKFTSGQRAVLAIPGLMVGVAVVGVLIAIVSGAYVAAFGVAIAVAILMRVVKNNRSFIHLRLDMNEALDAVHEKYPSIVAHLRRMDP